MQGPSIHKRWGNLVRPSKSALIAALVAFTFGAGARAHAAPLPAPLVVQTQQGPIQGSLIVPGVRRFAGVRYAAAPVGSLRWLPPQPAPNHFGTTVPATAFGSQCPQAVASGTDPNEGGNEDCLYLNVYAPADASYRKLPVMLFIHGGGFTSGSGGIYVPDSMVLQSHVSARAHAAPPPAPLVVQTQQGPIQGSVVVPGVRRFAGVRYAAAPVGALRWLPPQPAPNHIGTTVPATAFGSQCPQAMASGADPNEGGNEDCLYLNVYAPADASYRKLPVMLFIHGGGFTSGSGGIYVPDSMVLQSHVIVVTINYRLGLEGSLALSQLDATAPGLGSGTFNMQDQQAAMRWVRANAGSFGGNPNAVTIFGESAGADYVCEQVASPTAAGLFRGAISESGCGGDPAPTKVVAENLGQSLAVAAGCATGGFVDLACLRAKTPLQISQAAIAGSGNPLILTKGSEPMQGGGVLPRDYFAAVQQNRFNRVPLIIGSNHDEGNLFVFTGLPAPTSQAAYLAYLGELVSYSTGVAPATIAAQYPVSNYTDYAHALAAAMTDGAFACSTFKSDQVASDRTLVWAYEFNDPNAPNLYGLPSIGSAHGSELFYLFDMGATFTPAQQALSRAMISYWTTFATLDEPNFFSTPRWRLYQLNAMQNLGPQAIGPITPQSFSTRHHCGFWVPLL